VNILAKPPVKWIASIAAVIAIAIVLYLGAVLQVYVIALIVEIIGRIF
jgi:hypothetical protein